MGEEMGLAAQQYSAESGVPQEGTGMPTVDELIQLLINGITPQQLIEAGVPQQLVEQAIAMLNQQAPAAPTQGAMGQGGTPMDEQGLAMSSAMSSR